MQLIDINNSKNTLFVVSLTLFVILRLFVLATSLDLYNYEESVIGMYAKEVLSGSTIIPYFNFLQKFEIHHLGVLLNGYFVAFLYKIFYESGVILKLCWLFFSIITFCVYYKLIRKFFSKKVAFFAICLFVFSPPGFTFYNLTSMGIESGALLFIMIIMYLNFKMLPFRNNEKKDYIIYGLVSGLAVFYSHYCFFVVLVGFTYQALYNWRIFLSKKFLFLVFSFLLSFSPWIILNILYDFSWFQRIFELSTLSSPADRFLKLFTYILPRSFAFKDIGFVKGDFLNYSYYYICIVSFCICMFINKKIDVKKIKKYLKDEKNKEILVIIFILIYTCLFVFSKIHIHYSTIDGYRFFLILYPFAFLYLAIILNRIIIRSNMLKKIGFCAFYLLCILGLLGNASLVRINNVNFAEPSIYKPYDLDWLVCKVYAHANEDNKKLKIFLDKIEYRYNQHYMQGISYNLRSSKIDDPGLLLRECEKFQAYEGAFFQGLGNMIGRKFFEIHGLKESLESMPFKYRIKIDGTINVNAVKYLFNNPVYLEVVVNKLDMETRNFYLKHLGFSVATLLNITFEDFSEFFSGCTSINKKSLIEGYMMGLSWNLDSDNVIKYDSLIDEDLHEAFYKGIGFSVGLRKVPSVAEIINEGHVIEDKYKKFYYEGVGNAVGWHFIKDPTTTLKLVVNQRNKNKLPARSYSLLSCGIYSFLKEDARKEYIWGLGYGYASYACAKDSFYSSKFKRKVIQKWKGYFSSKDYNHMLAGLSNYINKNKLSSCYNFVVKKSKDE